MTERLESLNEVCEGVAGVKITLKNVVGHRPFLHQKCPYTFWFDQMVQKKPDPPILLNRKDGNWLNFFGAYNLEIWLNHMYLGICVLESGHFCWSPFTYVYISKDLSQFFLKKGLMS